MAAHRAIHMLIQRAELSGIGADQRRSEFGDTGASACGVGGKVGGTKRANLAVAGDAGIGKDFHDRRIKNLDRITARPLVRAFMERQFHTISANLCNSHCAPLDWNFSTRSQVAARASGFLLRQRFP